MAMIYLLLGTNLGDRTVNLAAARGFLEGEFGSCAGASNTVETEAVGFVGPAFLNRVEAYRTRRKPAAVLAACKGIERRMGRTDAPEYRADGSRVYHNRVIDIDILEYRIAAEPGKSLIISTPDLTIPHPQVEGRPFVRPLLDAAIEQTTKTKQYATHKSR